MEFTFALHAEFCGSSASLSLLYLILSEMPLNPDLRCPMAVCPFGSAPFLSVFRFLFPDPVFCTDEWENGCFRAGKSISWLTGGD